LFAKHLTLFVHPLLTAFVFQLERFPNKLSANGATQSVNVHPSGGVTLSSKATSGKKAPTQNVDCDEDSRYLLSWYVRIREITV